MYQGYDYWRCPPQKYVHKSEIIQKRRENDRLLNVLQCKSHPVIAVCKSMSTLQTNIGLNKKKKTELKL